jgi:hypothetical protein
MRSTLVVMLLVASAFAQDLSSRPASACGSKDVSFDAAPFTAHSKRLFAWYKITFVSFRRWFVSAEIPENSLCLGERHHEYVHFDRHRHSFPGLGVH